MNRGFQQLRISDPIGNQSGVPGKSKAPTTKTKPGSVVGRKKKYAGSVSRSTGTEASAPRVERAYALCALMTSTRSGLTGENAPNNSHATGDDGINKSKHYNLEKPGNVLILNNDFIVNKKSPGAGKYAAFERHGARQDVRDMVHLFERNLGCIVHVENRITSTALPEKLSTFKEACVDADSSFLVLIVLTHGGPGDLLLMHDWGEVNLFKDIISAFTDDAFEEFKGRPKIFLIQACANFTTPQPAAIAIHPPVVGELVDTFVGMAFLPFGFAWRRPFEDRGWYVQSIKDVFGEFWVYEDLETMHDRVRGRFQQKAEAENGGRPDSGGQIFCRRPYTFYFDFGIFRFPFPNDD